MQYPYQALAATANGATHAGADRDTLAVDGLSGAMDDAVPRGQHCSRPIKAPVQ